MHESPKTGQSSLAKCGQTKVVLTQFDLQSHAERLRTAFVYRHLQQIDENVSVPRE